MKNLRRYWIYTYNDNYHEIIEILIKKLMDRIYIIVENVINNFVRKGIIFLELETNADVFSLLLAAAGEKAAWNHACKGFEQERVKDGDEGKEQNRRRGKSSVHWWAGE